MMEKPSIIRLHDRISVCFVIVCTIGIVSCGKVGKSPSERNFCHRIDSISQVLKAKAGNHDVGPCLVPIDTIINVGEIKKSETLSKTVEVEFANVGKKDLVITSVECHCPCLSADFSKAPVKSKKRGYVTITIDVNDIKGGNFFRSFEIHSNSINGSQYIEIAGTITY